MYQVRLEAPGVMLWMLAMWLAVFAGTFLWGMVLGRRAVS